MIQSKAKTFKLNLKKLIKIKIISIFQKIMETFLMAMKASLNGKLKSWASLQT